MPNAVGDGHLADAIGYIQILRRTHLLDNFQLAANTDNFDSCTICLSRSPTLPRSPSLTRNQVAIMVLTVERYAGRIWPPGTLAPVT